MESRVKVSRSYSGVGFIKSKVTTEVFKAKFWFRDHVTINQYFIEKKNSQQNTGGHTWSCFFRSSTFLCLTSRFMERKQLQEPLEMHISPLNFLQRAVGFVFFFCIEQKEDGRANWMHSLKFS